MKTATLKRILYDSRWEDKDHISCDGRPRELALFETQKSAILVRRRGPNGVTWQVVRSVSLEEVAKLLDAGDSLDLGALKKLDLLKHVTEEV